MEVAVLSGKGGAGKTFISTSLASSIGNSLYLDCDVEEPNGYLYLKPKIKETRVVELEVPYVDKDLCTGCRTCVDFCKFNALGLIKEKAVVYEDLCHSCNGCNLLCPENAISNRKRRIGEIQIGYSEKVKVGTGILDIGEASGTAIIEELLSLIKGKEKNVIIDCPPGSACNVMDSIKTADYCLLVAEPSLFGLNNLKMIVDLVRIFEKDFGIIINKSFPEENIIEDYAEKENIDILLDIPYDQDLAYINSKGLIAARESEKYKKIFIDLWNKIRGAV